MIPFSYAKVRKFYAQCKSSRAWVTPWQMRTSLCAMRRTRPFCTPRRLVLGLLAGGILFGPATSRADATVTLKGKIVGGEHLLNPVWEDAKNPESHRYTFRTPSTTVSKSAKVLRAFLPKELCIAVLLKEGKAPNKGRPVVVHVSGGRTSPTTLVIPEGQNVEFNNHDPFRHKLYDTAKKPGGLGPEETPRGKSRVWLPPKMGTYEIRDELFPSVRSWIVVEPRAVACGRVNTKGLFTVPEVPPGQYEVRAYFGGKPIGKSLPVTVNTLPAELTITTPLIVAEKKKSQK